MTPTQTLWATIVAAIGGSGLVGTLIALIVTGVGLLRAKWQDATDQIKDRGAKRASDATEERDAAKKKIQTDAEKAASVAKLADSVSTYKATVDPKATTAEAETRVLAQVAANPSTGATAVQS